MKTTPDLSSFVNVNGERIFADSGPSFKAAPKTRTPPPPSHKGFLVEGHAPGTVKAAEAEANDAMTAWARLTPSQQADKIKGGERPPKPWNFEQWLLKTRRKRVAKPFGIRDAAELAKTMAESLGWEHVRVVELKKGKQ